MYFSKLSWKNHVDSIGLKISKTIGLLSKLIQFVPHHTRSIYNSLINPFLRYGLTVWGHASKTHLNKLLILQKRAQFRFIYFSDRRDHAIPLFLNVHILPLNFMHYKLPEPRQCMT